MPIALILLALFVGGCSTSPKKLADRKPKSDMGFKYTPPQSDGWFETAPPKGLKGIAYGKKIEGVDAKEHSVIFSVRYGAIETGLSKPEEVLNFVRMQKENQLQGIRFDVKKDHSKFVTFKGAKCLEFDSLVRDKHVNKNMTLTGLFCVHPDDHRRFVDISYSQRHEQARLDLDIVEEGREFIQSVSFLPILKKGRASR